MEKGLNVPAEGDYLVFTGRYIFIAEDNMSFEIPVKTLAKVIQVHFNEISGTDEVECSLIISLDITGDTKLFKFNYSLHQGNVSIIEKGKASKLLYEKG